MLLTAVFTKQPPQQRKHELEVGYKGGALPSYLISRSSCFWKASWHRQIQVDLMELRSTHAERMSTILKLLHLEEEVSIGFSFYLCCPHSPSFLIWVVFHFVSACTSYTLMLYSFSSVHQEISPLQPLLPIPTAWPSPRAAVTRCVACQSPLLPSQSLHLLFRPQRPPMLGRI